jgi:hypothetical protein
MQKSDFKEGVSSKAMHGHTWFHHEHGPEVDMSHIKIDNQKLTGTCLDHKEERAIIDRIEYLSGVRRVVSHLEILSDRG